MLQVGKGRVLRIFIVLIFMVFFAGCTTNTLSLEKQNSLQTIKYSKKEFDNISKDAVLEAIKKSFALSNKEKQFQINSYRNHILIQRITLNYFMFSSVIKVENWLFELEQKENKTFVKLSIYKQDRFDENKKIYYEKKYHDILWSRIENLLGLNKKWLSCRGYICSIFSSNEPSKDDYIKDVLISQRKAKLQAIIQKKIEAKKAKLKEDILKEYEAFLDFEEKDEEIKKQDEESIKIKNEFDKLIFNDSKSLKKQKQSDTIDKKLDKIDTKNRI